MKITVPRPTEYEVDAIRVEVSVNYGEEDVPNDFPFRDGDMWKVTVDIATGKIRDWPEGLAAEVHMKVADCGSYYLMAGTEEVASIENDYVPSCIPGEYGDYIEFDIAGDGTVRNWSKYAMAGHIEESFFSTDGH